MDQDSDNWLEAYGIPLDNIPDLLSLAEMFESEGDDQKAEQVYQHTLHVDPNHGKAKYLLETLRTKSVQEWHLSMLSDTKRNDAFDRAIKKHISKKSKVLDIGTGSGLLAMMAARAGANSILACEVNTQISKAAEEVVAANGFSDKIEIINKRSDLLEEGIDYEGKFNVIISEILGSGGLGEGVLSYLRSAKLELGTPDVKMIPAGISLKAQLIEIPKAYLVNPIKEISGFDLSIFDRFRVSDSYLPIDLTANDYKKLSDVFSLRSYDFYNIHKGEVDFDEPEIEPYKVEIVQEGQVQAVAFWFDLHMDEEDSYSTGPEGDLRHWLQAIYYFEEPKSVSPGDSISINALYSDWMVRFRMP